jgi:hypothetical protein
VFLCSIHIVLTIAIMYVERGVSASGNGIKIVLRIAARGRVYYRILTMDAILCMFCTLVNISIQGFNAVSKSEHNTLSSR